MKLVKATSTKPIVLASGSHIRKTLLENVGLTFDVCAADIDENIIKDNFKKNPPDKLSKILAKHKALAVSSFYKGSYVIGSDQICYLDDFIFSKPGNNENCFKTLTTLSGKTHTQNCGISIAMNNQEVWSFSDTAYLSMKNLTEKDILDYIQMDKPYDACGAYRYEANGKKLFKRVEGDINTIKGLTLDPLLNFLNDEGVIEFSS